MTYHLHHKPLSRKTGRWMIGSALAIGLLFSIIAGFSAYAASGIVSEPTPSPVYINEVKSGGNNTVIPQYVTVYNDSDTDLPLANWTVEYAKQAFAPSSCALSNWKLNSSSNVTTALLIGSVAPHSVSQPFALSINDNDPGAVHLVDSLGAVRDTIGWGSDSSPAPCFETSQAPKLTAAKSLQRYVGCISSLPIDSDDNSLDIMLSDTPRPGQTSANPAPACTPPTPPAPPIDTPPTPGTEPSPTDQQSNAPLDCVGPIISELLPNPAGSDSGHEFIELHNPTDKRLDLAGCSLQTSASTTKTFSLAGTILEPDAYLALYDSTTGLTLPNSAGGSVWLTSQANEVQEVVYAADMDDDTVWALNDGLWAGSFTPTPNAKNIATPLKPCGEGEVRNPDTNRCINAPVDSVAWASTTTASSDSGTGATACKEGQERNPATNRCRAIAATGTTTTVVACKAGQERNPDTNRCRNITSAASTAKDCPTGQERNADTNRCRKVTAAGSSNGSTLDKVKDVATASQAKSKPYWLIATAALGAALAYGIYEWRQELRAALNKLTAKLSFAS